MSACIGIGMELREHRGAGVGGGVGAVVGTGVGAVVGAFVSTSQKVGSPLQ